MQTPRITKHNRVKPQIRSKCTKLLEMSAATEVTLVYTSHRANVLTRSASRAFFVIYYGEIVHEGYCTFGAVLYALTASDTAVGAYLTHVSTLFMVAALDCNTLGVFYNVDKSVGARLDAQSASYTL